MRWLMRAGLFALMLAAGSAAFSSDNAVSGDMAMKVLDDYLAAVNARDAGAWNGTHHDDCFLVNAAGDVEVYSRENRMDPLFQEADIKALKWSRAEWESREAVESSDDKVHIMTRLTLFGENGRRMRSQDAIYIITKNEEWAIAGASVMGPAYYGSDGAPLQIMSPARKAELEATALKILDEYMENYDARDASAVFKTHNFPQFRLANKKFTLTVDKDKYLAGKPGFFALFRASTGFKWDHSDWTERKVAQVSETKIHVLTRYSRYEKDNTLIGTYQSLYVLTLQDGKWGIKGRSSFAPL